MMRAWPLSLFQIPKPGRWNLPLTVTQCHDCSELATLWVEAIKARTYERTYHKLCEPCYALRILGDNEKT